MQNVLKFPYMVIHLQFYCGFCKPQNGYLPAVLEFRFFSDEEFRFKFQAWNPALPVDGESLVTSVHLILLSYFRYTALLALFFRFRFALPKYLSFGPFFLSLRVAIRYLQY